MITLLTGPNSYTISQSVQKKTEAFGGRPENYDASELESRQLPDLFRGASLFSPKRLVIIRDAAVNKTLWAELEPWIAQVPEETDIVLVEPNPDKRTKTYKQLQKHAVIREHKELSEAELKEWLRTYARSLAVDLAPDVTSYLIAYVGRDQWRLAGELGKLLLAQKPLTKRLIDDIAEPYPEATAFELLDSVFKRDATRVEELVGILSAREDPYQFFGLLSSQLYALFAIVSSGGDRRPADIASDMALHPFVVSKLVSTAKSLGQKRVNQCIEMLAGSDIRIKTSGVDPWHQLKITLLSLCHIK